MMLRFYAFCITILLFTTCPGFAQESFSVDLINNAKEYNGKVIIYKGEIVGEVMKRAGFAWANIHDGETAIGVWVSAELARKITFSGNFKYKGDIVEVSGVFHRACAEHGGDLDIHADSLRVVSNGYRIKEQVNPVKIKIGVFLGVIIIILWILRLLNRR